MKYKSGNNRIMTRILSVLVCFAVLFTLAVASSADGLEIGTGVKVIVENSLTITSRTEDFTLGVDGSQQLIVTVSGIAPFTYVWTVSADGGNAWTTPQQATNAPSYLIRNAVLNPNKDSEGRDIPYQYKVTVSNGDGESDYAIIKVLVSDDYAYRTISLRNGDTDISSYMHKDTRLVVTPVGENTPAALALGSALADDCLPLLICDVKLINRNDEVVPYFGALRIDFYVGTQYNGRTLRVHHLLANTVETYSGEVVAGVLPITVNSLSPFMVEVSSTTVHTVTADAGTGGSISPAGSVNVADGADKTFTFLPNAGYLINQVLVNGNPVTVTGNSYTLTNITDDMTLSVSFSAVAPSDTLHTLTAISGSHGTLSPSGTVSVRHGAAQTVYFYPDAGYEVDAVLVNGVNVSIIGNSYTLSAVTATTAINVSFRAATTQQPDVYNTITAIADEGGIISPTGKVSVEYGGDMYFYFIPDSGYTPDKVYIDGVQTAVTGNCYHFVNTVAPHTIRVTFKSTAPTPPPTYHTVTAGCGANGSISPAGSITVTQGGSQTFTFTADTGYELDTVTVDGIAMSVSGRSYTLGNVLENHSVYVTFKRAAAPPAYYTVTAGCGANGSISPAGSITVAQGGSQEFCFTPDTGYEVNSVTVDGAEVASPGNLYRFMNVTGNHTLQVTFKAIGTSSKPIVYHTVTVDAGANGNISPHGGIRVADGKSARFWFIPDDGYEVDAVVIDGVKTEVQNGEYLFNNVGADHTIFVTFKEAGTSPERDEYHTITVTVDGHGSVSPAGIIQIPDGGSQTFYFIADEGYEVSAIYINGEKQTVIGSRFTVDNITGDTQLCVTFEQIGGKSPQTDCHCLWETVFGSCAICALFGRCISLWCWLIPLSVLAAVAIWLLWRMKKRAK